MRKFRSENSRKKGHFFITLNLNKILPTFIHEVQFFVQKAVFWIWNNLKKGIESWKSLKIEFLEKCGFLAQCEVFVKVLGLLEILLIPKKLGGLLVYEAS